MKRALVGLALALTADWGWDTALHAQTSQVTESVANISYAEASPVLEALRADLLPADLQGKTAAERAQFWSQWVSTQNAAIRARLERGDEDSIVNLLLFGVTFTKQERIKESDFRIFGEDQGAKSTARRVLEARIEDMVAGISHPGANERLQFARAFIERRGIDPKAADHGALRRYLTDSAQRVLSEYDGYFHPTDRAEPFRVRGLSSDTSIFPSFGIEESLKAIKKAGLLSGGGVRRVAIIGPGLDFADKRGGYDFYPQQTLQPFAVIDSLLRLGLANPDTLRLITFDLSSRINRHIDTARDNARSGVGYTLTLPRETDVEWNADLVAYWRRLGERIGDEAQGFAPPPGMEQVDIRTVRVHPSIVEAIEAHDLNVVLQRPVMSRLPDERFDLVIATNVLIYFDVFEQALAFENIATMLRPGGLFLSNNAVAELPGNPLTSVGLTNVVYNADRPDGTDAPVWYEFDRVIWYERQ